MLVSPSSAWTLDARALTLPVKHRYLDQDADIVDSTSKDDNHESAQDLGGKEDGQDGEIGQGEQVAVVPHAGPRYLTCSCDTGTYSEDLHAGQPRSICRAHWWPLVHGQ